VTVATLTRTGPGGAYRQPSIRVSRFTSGLPKVVVLHDHALMADVLRLTLADQIDIVGETRSGQAAVALSELYVADVVVVGDMLMDGVGEYFVPALLQTGAWVLLVTESLDLGHMLAMAELGITGIVDADRTPGELATAVLTLSAGGVVFPADVMASIAAEWRRTRRKGSDPSLGADLTARELEVLDAMSDGLSTKAVAHHLGIALKTVENHKTRIFDKLGVRSQAQAVAKVLGDGHGAGGPGLVDDGPS
jgi:DNA-binding NarL/FixJ family response regulator